MATVFFVLTTWAILLFNRSETLPTPTNSSRWPSGLIDYVKSAFSIRCTSLNYHPPRPAGCRLVLGDTVRPVSFAVLNEDGWFETGCPIYIVKIFSRLETVDYKEPPFDVMWFSIIQNSTENTSSGWNSAPYYVLYSSPIESPQAVLTKRMIHKIQTQRCLQYCSNLQITPEKGCKSFIKQEASETKGSPVPSIMIKIHPESNKQLTNAFKIASDGLTTVHGTIYTLLQPFLLKNIWYSAEKKKKDEFEDFYGFYFRLKKKQEQAGFLDRMVGNKPGRNGLVDELDLAEFRVGVLLNSKQQQKSETFEFIPLTDYRADRLLLPAQCTVELKHVMSQIPQLTDREEVTKFTVNTGCTLYSVLVDTIILKKKTGTTRKPKYVYSYYSQIRLEGGPVKRLCDATKKFKKEKHAIRTAYTQAWDLSGWLTPQDLDKLLGNDKGAIAVALNVEYHKGQKTRTITKDNFELGRLNGWNLGQTEFELCLLCQVNGDLNCLQDRAFFLVQVTVYKLMASVTNNQGRSKGGEPWHKAPGPVMYWGPPSIKENMYQS